MFDESFTKRQCMEMTGYTKLFGSIIASTIWREPNEIRIVWITMLALANKNGVVEASLPGLADLARVTIEECKTAITALQQPDEYSRTKDYEGRRIEPVDGGWFVLNHPKYRDKMGQDERREYMKQKQQEFRDRKKSKTSLTESTHSEADSDSEADSKANKKATNEFVAVEIPPELSALAIFNIAWSEFQEHRKQIKKPMTSLAAKKILHQLRQRPADAIAALDTAIRRSWQGFEWEWLDKEKPTAKPVPSTRNNF